MNSVTTSGTTVTNTTNSQNELTGMGNTTLTYDNNGNTITDDQGHTLIYDAWNRLVTVENSGGTMVEAYTYDGLGHRITEKPTGAPDDLYYSSQWQVVEEDISNSGLKLHADYVWSPVFVDALILRDEHLAGVSDGTSFSADDRVYAIQDANYNTTALLGHVALSADANGDGVVNGFDLVILAHNYGNYVTGGAADGDFNGDGVVNGADLGILAGEYNTSAWQVAQRFVYDAYGKEVTLTSTWTTTTDAFAWQYMYQGGRYDATTGLYDFRNREYSPTMMRWTTQDPLGYVDGMNDYGFVDDNPRLYADPAGTDLWITGGGNWGHTTGTVTVRDQNGNVIGTLTSEFYPSSDDDSLLGNWFTGEQGEIGLMFTPGGDHSTGPNDTHYPQSQKDDDAVIDWALGQAGLSRADLKNKKLPMSVRPASGPWSTYGVGHGRVCWDWTDDLKNAHTRTWGDVFDDLADAWLRGG